MIGSAEADLIAAARLGDDAAFERLVAPHIAKLHAYCYRMLGSVQDAEDALQETLLAACRDDVLRFMTRMWATPWRLVPLRANAQLAFACYQAPGAGDSFRLSAINVVSLRASRVVALTGFLDPNVHLCFGLAPEFRPPR